MHLVLFLTEISDFKLLMQGVYSSANVMDYSVIFLWGCNVLVPKLVQAQVGFQSRTLSPSFTLPFNFLLTLAEITLEGEGTL